MKRLGSTLFLASLLQLSSYSPRDLAFAEIVATPTAAQVPVRQLILDNGITVLLVPLPDTTTVAAGWMVRAGSADDDPEKTGLSHVLEHMMFKGSRAIGTRNLDRELEVLATLDRLWAERRDLEHRIEAASVKRRPKMETKLAALNSDIQIAQSQASALAFLGQYSFLYSEQGGTGLNANTYRDLTVYYVTLPSEKLEIWFWLESDRLLAPVFREFYKEIQVIHEERRQRIESTATGRLDEEVRELFWRPLPYAWNPMGRPEDLDRLSRDDAVEFFRQNYRPEEMTLALVGGFDAIEVEAWARSYFGRLPRSKARIQRPPVEPSLTKRGEQRYEAQCRCSPQANIFYPTASFGEDDADALQLLSAVLNGRTGRLYRSLVLDQQIAFSAFTQQISWRQQGQFSLRAESKGDTDPENLVRAWDEQVRRLQTEPPTTAEILRARNRSIADAFRSLQDPTALMKQLLIYQGLGDWRYINDWSARLQRIHSEDLVRVASTYLLPQRRTVALYRRSATPSEP